MESAGNAVVDFGRFCTGFLVVMGVGMAFPFSSEAPAADLALKPSSLKRLMLTLVDYSPPSIIGTLRPHCCPSDGYVNNWRTFDLWNYYKLHDVFPGRARLLESLFYGCVRVFGQRICWDFGNRRNIRLLYYHAC